MLVPFVATLLLLPSLLSARPTPPRNEKMDRVINMKLAVEEPTVFTRPLPPANVKMVEVARARWISLSSDFYIPGSPTASNEAASTSTIPSTSTTSSSTVSTRATAEPTFIHPSRRANAAVNASPIYARALATPSSLHEKRFRIVVPLGNIAGEEKEVAIFGRALREASLAV